VVVDVFTIVDEVAVVVEVVDDVVVVGKQNGSWIA
jgi:hypothetical protein